MILSQLPRLRAAMVLLGLDNGADPIAGAKIPVGWETRCRIAEDELAGLAENQVEALAMGEDAERKAAAALAPNADAVVCAAFDGALSKIFFRSWRGIHDARRAESRAAARP